MSQYNDIKITPNIGVGSDPKIEFIGAGNSTITLRVLDSADGGISFDGQKAQLLSLVDADVSFGSSIPSFSVNDYYGVPQIQAYNDGKVIIAPYGSQFIGIGTLNPSAKLDVRGDVNVSGIATFQNNIRVNGIISGIATFENNIRVNGITVGVSTKSSTNIAIGNQALLVDSASVTDNNIAIGNNALRSNAGEIFGRANIAIGGDALKSNTGENNTAIGYRCLENNQGYHNLAVGFFALRDTTTGGENTSVGGNSNYQNISGSQNSSLGHNSLNQNLSGSHNVALGNDSLLSNTTGNYNIGLGAYVGVTTNRSRKILIGSGNGSNRFDSPDTTSDTQLAIGQRTSSGVASYWIVGDENYNVGIGTRNPTAKLDVGGDLKVGINTSQGLILTSPNGTTFRLVVDDSGTLSAISTTL